MRQAFTTLTELAGGISITIGAFRVSEAVGFMVAGLLLITFSALVADT